MRIISWEEAMAISRAATSAQFKAEPIQLRNFPLPHPEASSTSVPKCPLGNGIGAIATLLAIHLHVHIRLSPEKA